MNEAGREIWGRALNRIANENRRAALVRRFTVIALFVSIILTAGVALGIALVIVAMWRLGL